MPPVEPVARGRVSLVDALDHLLNRGAVISGDATLSIAGIDLVYVGLNLIIASVETLQGRGGLSGGQFAPPPLAPGGRAPTGSSELDTEESAALEPVGPLPALFDSVERALNPLQEREAHRDGLEGLEKGADSDLDSASSLARLVLTLVELLRQLVERQALRRVEASSLSAEQVERMGRALMELSAKMAELRDLFGLEEQDLEIDLGPLGRLI